MVRPEHSNVTTIDLNSPSTYTELVKRRLELRRRSLLRHIRDRRQLCLTFDFQTCNLKRSNCEDASDDVDMEANIRILTPCSPNEPDPGHAPPQRSAGLPRSRRNGNAVLLPKSGC